MEFLHFAMTVPREAVNTAKWIRKRCGAGAGLSFQAGVSLEGATLEGARTPFIQTVVYNPRNSFVDNPCSGGL